MQKLILELCSISVQGFTDVHISVVNNRGEKMYQLSGGSLSDPIHESNLNVLCRKIKASYTIISVNNLNTRAIQSTKIEKQFKLHHITYN